MHGPDLPDVQLHILAALAEYRFLTPKQFHRLGVSRSYRHVQDVCQRISPPTVKESGEEPTEGRPRRRRPHGRAFLIDRVRFDRARWGPRRDHVYYLTRDGEAALKGQRGYGARWPVPVGEPDFPSDYDHRRNCVDFHIALNAWAEKTGTRVDFFSVYYAPLDKDAPVTITYGNRRQLSADAFFALTGRDGERRFFILEMCNGSDTDRFAAKLTEYTATIPDGGLSRGFRLPQGKGARILFVFNTQNGERLTRRHVRERADFAYPDYFFFKTLSEAQSDFKNNWRQVKPDRSVPLFTDGSGTGRKT